MTHVGNQRNQDGFNNRPGNVLRPYGQDQFYQDGYRNDNSATGTSDSGASRTRSVYSSSQPPLRNQFPTFYQFRFSESQFQASSYQNRAYQSQQSQQQKQLSQQSGNYQSRSQDQTQITSADQDQLSENIGRSTSSNPAANASASQRSFFRSFQNYNNQVQL